MCYCCSVAGVFFCGAGGGGGGERGSHGGFFADFTTGSIFLSR